MNETRRARPGPAARRLWASAMLIAFAAIADGMRGEQAQASEPPKRGDVTAHDDAERGEQRVSAPALMCGVYDSLAWIDSAASVRIVTRYQTTPTQDEAQWRTKQPRRGLMVGNQEPDARTYCVDSEWAWDEKRIRHCTESYYDGDDAASSDPKRDRGHRQSTARRGAFSDRVGRRRAGDNRLALRPVDSVRVQQGADRGRAHGAFSEKKRALEKKQAAQQKKRGEAAANKARAPATPAKPD